jgi:hypothetical protein
VHDGYAYCSSHDCSEGTAAYEDWSTPSRDKHLVDLVAQLRSLAARASTQAEAEAAFAAAERIVARYQIDEARIDQVDAAHAEEPIEAEEPLWTGKSTKVWLNMLANGLCNDHGCSLVIHRRTLGRQTMSTVFRFAGTPKDLELVRYLFAWLHVEIDRLARREHGIAAINAFRVGAVVGVLRAMREARQVEVKQHIDGDSVAMVLVERSERSFLVLKEKIRGKLGKSSGPSLHNADAFNRGTKAGEGMSSKHGLAAGSGHLALGQGKR